ALQRTSPGGFWVGPVILGLGWLLWSWGLRQDVQAFWHGGAVLVTLGGVMTFLGLDVLKRAAPAILLLAFMVPVPGMIRQGMAQPMQHRTAQATQFTAEMIGMPVERWGNMLSYAGTEVAVAEAGNGMRMVFTLLLVSYTFAFITPLKPHVRLAIIVASPATAILCNVVRLVPTVWVFGHYPDIAQTFHDVSGWLMLGVAFLLLTSIIHL